MTAPNIHNVPVTSTSFVPGANPIPPPSNFLSLAPATSASYPTAPLSSSPPRSVTSTAIASPAENKVIDPIAEPGADALTEVIAKQRRSSSSVSSESSGSVKQRFLKLGPAHWGENRDGKGDWAEME